MSDRDQPPLSPDPAAAVEPGPPPAATAMPPGAPEAPPEAPPEDVPPPDPDWERICADPVVRDALRAGKVQHAVDLLRAWRKRSQDPAEQAALDRLLASPRRLAVPVAGPPSLGSLNGFGTTLYGQREVDPEDGTYVATQWLTGLFVPVYPLDAYLVLPAAEADSWYFLARVPLPPWQRLWRKLFLVAAVAAAAVVALVVFGVTPELQGLVSRSNVVHVTNDLGVPVRVRLGPAAFDVTPGGRVARQVPKGRHHATVMLAGDGRVIEEQDVRVTGDNAVIYNVLGASPLYIETVTYGDNTAPGQVGILAGTRFISKETVHYLFEPPEQQVYFEEYEAKLRVRLDRADGGWITAVNLLGNADRLAEAAELAGRVALVQPEHPVAARTAVELYVAVGRGEDALRVAATAARLRDDVEAHRMHQYALERVGRAAESRALYRQRFAERPQSAAAGYLRVRPEPLLERLVLYPQVLKQFPDFADAREGYGITLFRAERYADAVKEFEWSRTNDPRSERAWIEEHAAALAALGRVREAQAAVLLFLGPQQLDIELLTLYARLAKLPGASGRPVEDLFGRVPEGDRQHLRAWLAVRLGERDAAAEAGARPDWGPSFEAIHAIPRDPARARALVAALPDKALPRLPVVLRALLAAELTRTGDAAGAKRLLASDVGLARLGPALADPKLDPLAVDVNPELRAVLFMDRGRREAAAEARARLYEAARARDILKGEVSAALYAWPAP